MVFLIICVIWMKVRRILMRFVTSVYSDFSIQSDDFSYFKQIFNISNINLSLNDIESSLLSLVETASIDCHGIQNISLALFLFLRNRWSRAYFLITANYLRLFQFINLAQKRIYVTIGRYLRFLVFQSYQSPSYQTEFQLW